MNKKILLIFMPLTAMLLALLIYVSLTLLGFNERPDRLHSDYHVALELLEKLKGQSFQGVVGELGQPKEVIQTFINLDHDSALDRVVLECKFKGGIDAGFNYEREMMYLSLDGIRVWARNTRGQTNIPGDRQTIDPTDKNPLVDGE